MPFCAAHVLFVLEIPDAAMLPDLRLPSPRFVCLLVWDAENASGETLAQVAEWLLDQGAVYVCCWGKDCERVHDAFDSVIISRNPDCDPLVRTTWHSKEPLAEAIYFALYTAWPDEEYASDCRSVLAVCIGNSELAGTVRAAFADPCGFRSGLYP